MEGSRSPKTLTLSPPVRNRHHHAIEQASRRCTRRCTRRKILISTQHATDGDGVARDLHRVREAAVHRVVLEHVAHVVHRDEGVVHAHNRDVGVRLRRAHDEAANTSESIDTDADRHFCACARRWRHVAAIASCGGRGGFGGPGAPPGDLICEEPARNLGLLLGSAPMHAPLAPGAGPASLRKCIYKAQELVATSAVHEPPRQRLHFGIAMGVRYDVDRLLAACFATRDVHG